MARARRTAGPPAPPNPLLCEVAPLRSTSRSPNDSGFTLVETLVVIGIVILLAGITYNVLGPAREKARQAVCISNLHQIYMGIVAYRADYNGKSPPGRWDYWQLGLPRGGFELLVAGYTPARAWRCPDDPKPERSLFSYNWNVWDEEERQMAHWPPFGDAVLARGNDFPLVGDENHMSALARHRREPPFIIVLRLGGQIDAKLRPSITQAWRYW